MPVQPLPAQEKIRQFFFRCLFLLPLPEQRRYFLTICHQPAFVWYRVAKVGTRTITSHFNQHNVPIRSTMEPDFFYAPRLYRRYFKFAFVRNPWARLVSCWQSKVVQHDKLGLQETMSDKFDAFVHLVAQENMETCNKHYRLQCRLIDLNRLDFLGRMERFADDFHHVCKTLEIPYETIARKNASRDQKDYRSFYTDELAEIVGRLYRQDIELFGYAFDSPPQR